MTSPNLHEIMKVDMTDEALMNYNFDLDYIFTNLTIVTFLTLFPRNIVLPFIKKMKLIYYDRTLTPYCKSCKRFMGVRAADHLKIKYHYRCHNDHKSLNPLEYTWFKHGNLTFLQILLLTFCWVSNFNVITTVKHSRISKHSVIDWFVFCRLDFKNLI